MLKRDRYQIVSYITIMGMEVCWLYTWLDFFNQKTISAAVATLPLLLFYPLAFISSLLLQRLSWHKTILDILHWVIWAVLALLFVKLLLYPALAPFDSLLIKEIGQAFIQIFRAFQPELFILFSSIPLWWFGQRMSHAEANFPLAVSEFQFGIALMAGALFVASQVEITIAGSTAVIITFACCGLLGLAIAHAREGKSWLSGISRGNWQVLLFVSIVLVILIGLLISFLVTPDVVQVLLNILKWIGNLITRILNFLANLLPGEETVAPIEEIPGGGEIINDTIDEISKHFLSDTARNVSKVAFGTGMFIAIMLALWRISSQIVSWLRHRTRGTGVTETRSLSGAFRDDIRNFLRRIWQKLLRLHSLFPVKSNFKAVSPEIATVHQIYHQLLQWAERKGYPRQVAQTPHELLLVLTHAIPETQNDLTLVTNLYTSIRYGASLPTEEELAQMKQSWENIKRGENK